PPAAAEGAGGTAPQRPARPGWTVRVPRRVDLAGVQEPFGHLAGRRFPDLPGLYPAVPGPESAIAGAGPAPPDGARPPADPALPRRAAAAERDRATATARHLAPARGDGVAPQLGAGDGGTGRAEPSAADPGQPEVPSGPREYL